MAKVQLLRLYEKWFEQRLEDESGRYAEPRWVQKVAFWRSRDHVTVVSETFHTVSLVLQRHFALRGSAASVFGTLQRGLITFATH
jgi:hypothetical protein